MVVYFRCVCFFGGRSDGGYRGAVRFRSMNLDEKLIHEVEISAVFRQKPQKLGILIGHTKNMFLIPSLVYGLIPLAINRVRCR